MRAAFLEVLNDALGSLGVIVAAVVIATTDFTRADAIAGLLIAALIVPRAFILMRETMSVLMEFTPKGLDLDKVRDQILGVEGVIEVHDLHSSTVATGLLTLSAHIVIEDELLGNESVERILTDAKSAITEHSGIAIDHIVLQIESENISKEERM